MSHVICAWSTGHRTVEKKHTLSPLACYTDEQTFWQPKLVKRCRWRTHALSVLTTSMADTPTEHPNREIMSPQCRPDTHAPSHWCILPVVVPCLTAKAIAEHRQAPHQVSAELKSMTSPRISLTCSLGLMFLQWKYSAVFATSTAPISSYQTRNTFPAGHGSEQPCLVSLAHSSHRAHGSRVWTARCVRKLTQRSMANCCAQFLAAHRPCPATLVKSQTSKAPTPNNFHSRPSAMWSKSSFPLNLSRNATPKLCHNHPLIQCGHVSSTGKHIAIVEINIPQANNMKP